MTTTQPPVLRINPGTWNAGLRFDQAQLRPAPAQVLTLAGQGPLDVDGNVLCVGDVGGQLGAAMDGVAALLAEVGMTFADVFRMVVYVTDAGAALGAYSAITDRLDACGATPPATLVEVAALALPGMAVEIEVTAGR